MSLRKGTQWGALLQASSKEEALERSHGLINKAKNIEPDWPYLVSRKEKATKTIAHFAIRQKRKAAQAPIRPLTLFPLAGT